MGKVVITQFSDPMMGLSWECEPALQQIASEYGTAVELRDVMGLLVRDVSDFMTPEERALPEAEGIARYNARLAEIYLDEQTVGGVPINMDGFALFAPDRRSSLPLCLAYEAAKLVCPVKSRAFLLRLREATVWECRPTTKMEEIMRVVALCGIDEHAFLDHFEGGAASAALLADLQFKERLGIWALPAFLVECDGQSVLVRGVANYDTLTRAIDLVTLQA